MAGLELENISKSFGSLEVIHDINLEVDEGEFIVFVGPSGCGKSTVLRMISGLESVTSGRILIGGRDVTHLPAAQRQIAMVFQSYALFPHMNVADNISFGLRLTKLPKADIAARVAEVADVLQITPLLKRYPRQLSGGQRQRVAIGRAIIRNPKVFLFDEPLSNLDAALRVQMRLEIAHLHRRLRATILYVTHDQTEAMTLANRIVVLNNGHIEQVGAPLDLYEHPVNQFVAGFIGAPAMNFFAADLKPTSEGTTISLGQTTLTKKIKARIPGKITIGIRPEHLRIARGGKEDFIGEVDVIEALGVESIAYLQTEFSPDPVILRYDPTERLSIGERLPIALDHNACHFFDGEGKTLSD